MVQWLRLCAPAAGNPGLIPGQGTRSHMLQLRVHMLLLRVLCATIKTQCSQINENFKKNQYLWKKERKQDSDRIVQVKEPRGFGGFPGGAAVKNLPANAEDKTEVCSSPKSGRYPGGGNGNPLQCSCLESPMDREVRWVSTGLQRVRHDWARVDIGLSGGILQVRPNKMDVS